jgi:hypothetical protein
MARATKTYIYILLILACICIGISVAFLYPNRVDPFTTYSLPRIIWSYWHDPQIPPNIEKIMKEREAVLSTWEHRVLNEETVYDYIPRDAFPEGYYGLSHQHKADWIRLYLLKTYAGCWMDASIIVNRSDEIEELYKESLEQNSELTGYYLPERLAKGNPRSWIENFFLIAPKGSSIIEKWLDEFTLAIKMGLIPYKQRVFSKKDVSNIYSKDDDNTYFTVYASLQYILYDSDRMIIKDASKSIYTYHDKCRWNSPCVIDKIKNTPKENQPDSIKLIGNDRNYI